VDEQGMILEDNIIRNMYKHVEYLCALFTFRCYNKQLQEELQRERPDILNWSLPVADRRSLLNCLKWYRDLSADERDKYPSLQQAFYPAALLEALIHALKIARITFKVCEELYHTQGVDREEYFRRKYIRALHNLEDVQQLLNEAGTLAYERFLP